MLISFLVAEVTRKRERGSTPTDGMSWPTDERTERDGVRFSGLLLATATLPHENETVTVARRRPKNLTRFA